MIENLPDVSHLRYRGEPVEWRPGYFFGGHALHRVGSADAEYIGRVVPWDDGGILGAAYAQEESSEPSGADLYGGYADVAAGVVERLVALGIVTVVA